MGPQDKILNYFSLEQFYHHISMAEAKKKKKTYLGKLFCQSHFILLDGQNSLKIVWNSLKKKYVKWFDFVNFEVV